jgi:outer membrane immunogenic protein
MKRLVLASVVVLAFASGSALAADLPLPVYKAPPPVASVPSWTGCYVNGGGGFGLLTSNHHVETIPGLVPLAPATDTGGQGWMGLVGGGCDYQFPLLNWNVVVGAFGDYDFMNLTGTAGALGVTGNVKESSAWAGGLRAGVLVSPTVLIYTNGGYTGAAADQVNFAVGGVPFGLSLPSQNFSGWFVGGGTEASLNWIMPGLFLRTEYRYSSYQSRDSQLVVTATGAPPAGPPFAGFGINANLATQAVYTELVWRFNFGGPLSVRN